VDLLLKASTLGGRMGTTRSGKTMYGPEHPVYADPEHGQFGMRAEHGQLASRLSGFHHWNGDDHRDAVSQHRARAHWFEQAWGAKIKDAHRKTFGKDWEHADYKVSGIGSDAYQDSDKHALRRLAHGRTLHLQAAETHAKAARIAGRYGDPTKTKTKNPPLRMGGGLRKGGRYEVPSTCQDCGKPVSGDEPRHYTASFSFGKREPGAPRHDFAGKPAEPTTVRCQTCQDKLGKSHFRAIEEKTVAKYTCADCGAGVKASMGMGKQVAAVGGTRGPTSARPASGSARPRWRSASPSPRRAPRAAARVGAGRSGGTARTAPPSSPRGPVASWPPARSCITCARTAPRA
jgi:hypothetical protein